MTGEERFTGAAARGTTMIIITVRIEGADFVVCEEASGRLVMEDRSQADMRHFAAGVADFVERTGVSRILLRGAPNRGEYAAHPRIYKMEAALQLHPGLKVAIITPATLLAWGRRSGSLEPDVHHSVTARHEELLHREATRAACMAAMGWPETFASIRRKRTEVFSA